MNYTWVSPVLTLAGFGLVVTACWLAAKADKGELALLFTIGAGILAMGVAL